MNQKVPPFKRLVSAKDIETKITAFAAELNKTYQGKTLVLVAVLKGAVCFLADLMRKLEMDVEIAFIRASSYGQRGTERGELTIEPVGSLEIKDKEVLVLDDIFDSGKTLEIIVKELNTLGPKSLKTAVLLSKTDTQMTPYRPDHSLFEIDDNFVIGYGLDHKERCRHLPDICMWEELS